MSIEGDPRRDTLHELLLLRDEYARQVKTPGLDLQEKERLFRLIRELTACIDRIQKELARSQ